MNEALEHIAALYSVEKDIRRGADERRGPSGSKKVNRSSMPLNRGCGQNLV
jgi:hypothetical protein